MRIFIFLLSQLFIFGAAYAFEPGGVKTPLIGIMAVDDEESKVREPEAPKAGGMEMSRFFSTHVHQELISCGKTISTEFKEWIKENKLIPTIQRYADDSVFIHVWDKDQKGMFEASYKMSSGESANVRVALDYYSITGQKLAIETINSLLAKYEISALWDDLAEALECDL